MVEFASGDSLGFGGEMLSAAAELQSRAVGQAGWGAAAAAAAAAARTY